MLRWALAKLSTTLVVAHSLNICFPHSAADVPVGYGTSIVTSSPFVLNASRCTGQHQYPWNCMCANRPCMPML
jgi:hypothetical protein